MSIRRLEVEIPKFLNGVLIKDLNENEVICAHCEGTGLAIRDNIYDIKGEDGLNYMQQSLTFCQHCYNGVREKCRFCGGLLPRGYSSCNCEGYKKYKEDERIRAEEERYNKAEKMTYEEYIEKYPDHMIYCEDNGQYYTELEDMVEDYEDWELGELPKYVYGTHKTHMIVDIDNAIENACDELHEEAMYELKGLDELYSAINDFNILNKKNTTTFYPNYGLVILL